MKEYIILESEVETLEKEFCIELAPVREDRLIRCKDCVYFTPEKSGEHWNICRFYDAPKKADGYCNDAEPKETTEEVRKQLKDMEQRREMDRKK